MTRTNWNDGGGFYPPGSDTRDAPWNAPEPPEPTEPEYEKAEAEVWPFRTFDESAKFNDISLAAEYLDTDEAWAAVELCEACGKDHPIAAIDDDARKTLKRQAGDYINERAAELANEVDWEYERACAHADDVFDQRREERDR